MSSSIASIENGMELSITADDTSSRELIPVGSSNKWSYRNVSQYFKNMRNTSKDIFGLFLVLVSTAMFSLMSLAINLIGQRVPSFETSTIRFAVQALCTIVTVGIARKDRIFDSTIWFGHRENWRWLVSRGLWGAGGFTSVAYGLSTVTISDATTLFFLNVPITAILAYFMLGEEITTLDILTTILSMVGVVFIAQPAFIFGISQNELPILSVVVLLFGAFASSMAYISIRQVGTKEDTLTLVVYFSLVGVIVSPICAAIFQSFVAIYDPYILSLEFIAGVLGFSGQLFLSRGVQLSPAGPATAMRYMDIVLGMIFQTFIVGVPPDGYKILGAVLIMSCVLSTIHKVRKKDKKGKAKGPVGVDKVRDNSSTELTSTSGNPLQFGRIDENFTTTSENYNDDDKLYVYNWR
jgi:drug/metabolite transporter (DMT)-like permease